MRFNRPLTHFLYPLHQGWSFISLALCFRMDGLLARLLALPFLLVYSLFCPLLCTEAGFCFFFSLSLCTYI
ncbi:hypothetical protein BDV12DRAFT_126435 [Aspergillus spectabilis]